MLNFFKNLYDFMNQFTNYYEQAVKGIPLQKNSPIYVYREVDAELYQFLTSPQIYRACYILGSPQMGKTSLIIRTAKRLGEEGKICIMIALSNSLQTNSVETISEEFLYWRVLEIICQQINYSGKNLENSLKSFWNKSTNVAPDRKFKEFLKYLLQKLNNYFLIIFLDNIESLICLNIYSNFISCLHSLSISNKEYFQRLYFVISGVVKPTDLFDSVDGFDKIDIEKVIQLNYLQGNCQPLLVELDKVTSKPSDVIKKIMLQTGGQPFLTQILCSLVVKNNKFRDNLDTTQHIEELINTHILQKQDQSNPISLHISKINDYFIRGDPEKSTERILALNLYKRILRNPQYYKFDSRSNKQMDLLMAGLVVESENFISVANPIYEQIFSQKWVEETKKKINNTGANMAYHKIFNRDVFFLIDGSSSMDRTDTKTGGERRCDNIKELISGHANEILKERDNVHGKICDEITLYFFSMNQYPTEDLSITDREDIYRIFEDPERRWTGFTYIKPTLEHVIDTWLRNRQNRQGALVVVYTDGDLSDRKAFLELIQQTCLKIDNHTDIKILILGFGSDVEQQPKVIDFYVGVDVNYHKFKHNIVIFDLLNEMREGIIPAFVRQLGDNPERGLAMWVKKDYPTVYEKYKDCIE